MRRGNQVPVVAYLQAGGDPNGFIDDGQPLIHLALEYPAAFREDRSGIIRWLVKSGVDPDSREESGVPPLSYCKYPGEVSALLDLGADVNARDFEDWTALMYVSGRTHSLALTRLLLRRGADLTMTARCGSDAMSLGGWRFRRKSRRSPRRSDMCWQLGELRSRASNRARAASYALHARSRDAAAGPCLHAPLWRAAEDGRSCHSSRSARQERPTAAKRGVLAYPRLLALEPRCRGRRRQRRRDVNPRSLQHAIITLEYRSRP